MAAVRARRWLHLRSPQTSCSIRADACKAALLGSRANRDHRRRIKCPSCGRSCVATRYGQPHRELRPHAHLAAHADIAAMLVYDDGVADGESLPRASPNFFGGKEGVIKLGEVFLGDTATVVAYADHGLIALRGGADQDFAAVDILSRVLDGMGRVDDEVQEYLVQLTHIANHLRQLTEFRA